MSFVYIRIFAIETQDPASHLYQDLRGKDYRGEGSDRGYGNADTRIKIRFSRFTGIAGSGDK